MVKSEVYQIMFTINLVYSFFFVYQSPKFIIEEVIWRIEHIYYK